jgi:glucose-6-phosphate isomerase
MLPALICGIDPMKIRKGAKNYRDNCFKAAADGAFFAKENHHQHVFFMYSDKLSCFGQWLAQLYAESTGKMEIGITPLIARGSVDQHSQLQLYLAGPKNKSFTFLLEKQETRLQIPSAFTPSGFEYLKGKNLQSVFEAQCDATLDSVLKKHMPVRKIEFDSITPEILGELFMHFMLEVIMVCNLMDVNAFDQQAVEYAKSRTKELLNKSP